MGIWKEAEGLCLGALSPQGLLEISPQTPANQLCKEQGENLCVALGRAGFCACWGALVGTRILVNATQQHTVAFLGA